MTQEIHDILDINISHSNTNNSSKTTTTTVATPDTGVGSIASELGATGCLAIGVAVATFIAAIVLFCMRKKLFKAKRFKIVPSLALLLVSGALVVAGTGAGVGAARSDIDTGETEISVITNPSGPVVASGSRNITLEDYPYGYTVFAYLNSTSGDNSIYKTDLSTSVKGTKPTDSVDLNSLDLNSYGVKNQILNNYQALPTNANEAMPIFTTGTSEKKTFALEYAVRLDNSMAEGVYRSDANNGEIVYIVKSGQLINISSNADGVVDKTALVECEDGVCVDTENNSHYVDPEGDGVYVYVYTISFSANNPELGTVEPVALENVPHGTQLVSENNTIKANGSVIATATPKESSVPHYKNIFTTWASDSPTVVGPTSVVANFEQKPKEYKITLNNQEAVTAGTEEIYETYGEKFSLTSGGDAITKITLPAKTDGATFAGYYTETNGAGTKYIDAEGNLLAESTTFTEDSTLYAKWEASKPFFTITTMQEMTSEICATATTPNSSAVELTYIHTDDKDKVPTNILEDTRDNKTYRVSKLADGNCWMTANLDLQLDKTKTLDNTDTDLNTISEWTPSASTGDWSSTTDNTIPRSARPIDNTEYGTYYNWAAAVASNENVSGKEAGTKMPNSICPKGWRLPTVTISGGNVIDSEYGQLTTKYGITAASTAFGNSDARLLELPLSFKANGWVREGVYQNQQAFSGTGYLWTNTFAGTSGYDVVYSLVFGHTVMANGVYPVYGDFDGTVIDEGHSIRCVAR